MNESGTALAEKPVSSEAGSATPTTASNEFLKSLPTRQASTLERVFPFWAKVFKKLEGFLDRVI